MRTVLLAARGWDPAQWAKTMQAALPSHRVVATDREGVYDGEVPLDDIAYLLAWKPRQDLVDAMGGLEVLFSLGAGVDHLTSLDNLPEVPIVRIVDPDLTMRMTEWIVWQVLHHHRQGFGYARQQAERQWEDLKQPAARDVNVGIMGSGVLGSDAAGALSRLGFNVATWSRSGRGVEGIEAFGGSEGMDAFLARTDILVCLLPLTRETEGLVDHRMLGKLRRDGPLPGPVFINAGRGRIHVEDDVLKALRDGTLAGASLDVFEVEPLPGGSPLWDLPNLIVTPHVAAVSDAEALARGIAEQIHTYEAGGELLNRVEPGRGY